MIVARVIDPSSKLATARGLNSQTCVSTLGELLGVASAERTSKRVAFAECISSNVI